METILETITEFVTGFGLRVVGVIVLLFVAFRVAALAQRLVVKVLSRRDVDRSLTIFAGSAARWTVVLLSVIAALGVFGVETTSFAAVIGAAALAIGLAFQGSLSNLAAGVMLLVFRPFKSGDVVEVAGKTGKIDAITLFTTTLDTPDNMRIIIPNSAVFGAVIQNITYHDTRRVDVAVGAEYSASLDETRATLENAARAVATTVDGALEEPAPTVVLMALGGSSIDWQVRVWARTSEFFAVKEATTRAVKLALDEAGIGIPFPQLDVHLDDPNASRK